MILLKAEFRARGTMLITVIVATALFLIVLLGGISMALMQQKLNIRKIAQTQALYIAEAGVNYYRWVLYHERNEYCNNEPCKSAPDYGPYGPYTYTDDSGATIGHYELYIIPPAINGSTIVTIRSVGWVDKYPNNKRTVEVQCGIPSWSTYATFVNSELSYGAGSEVWGPIHSNTQIKMDGTAHNSVTAYELTSNLIEGNNEWGVYTHSGTDDPHPNTPANSRPDVFMAGRRYGPANVQKISFSPMANYASAVYALATSSGLVFDPRAVGTADPFSVAAWRGCIAAGTCTQGFSIELMANNIFRMRGVRSVTASCNSNPSWTYSLRSAYTDYNIPANGIIFVKHNTWVEGTINNSTTGSRVTILAYTDNFANNNNTNIAILNNIRYTLTDGRDSIGLIAQRDVLVGKDCPNDLRIDAALVAVNGKRARLNYGSCTSASRNSITIFGSTASYLTPYMSPGFTIRNYIYDTNLTYAPPPHYPTTGEYTFISWEEK